MSTLDPSLIAELRELVQRIGMISHISGTSYDGKVARDTSESIGGRRPSGSDVEPRPRNADEEAAWLTCYQRRTPDYFSRQLERCHTDMRLQVLIVEARETLEAWKHTPIPKGQEPDRDTLAWKCTVADDPRPIKEIQRVYSISRSTVNRYRAAYRGVRRTIWTSDG